MEQTSYPLSWPVGWKRCTSRGRSRFGSYHDKPSVAKGTKLILLELQRMGIPDHRVVISTNLQLRLDGLPYSNRNAPNDPGAAVYWTSSVRTVEKRMVIACDRWSTVGENLYTIGKTIEATRAIERWGAVTTEQAFAGYVALEEKTERSCWEVLGIPDFTMSSASTCGEQVILDAYRRKARETHPDNGGNAEAFAEVVRAKDMALQLIK